MRDAFAAPRVVLLFAVLTLSCRSRSPQVAPSGARPPEAAPAIDTLAAERDRLIKAAAAAIAGHETEQASAVFKNVQVLRTVPAQSLLQAMTFYGRALGVPCSFCHVSADWAADTKPEKQIARDMMRMNGIINGQLLKSIKNLPDSNPTVNCLTCHRGHAIPTRTLR